MSEQDIMDIPVNSYRKLKQKLLSLLVVKAVPLQA